MFTRSRRSSTGMVGRFAALCVATACVAVALASSHTSPTNVSVLANTPDRVIIQFQFPDFQSTTVDLKGEPHSLINLPGEPRTLVAGAPELPHVARSIIIPDDGSVEVRVTDSSFDDLQNVAVAPSKGNLPRTIDPATVPYTFGASYGKDAFFPGELATLHDPYILRDHRGVAVDIFPFQYNPVTRTLRVYHSLTVEITCTAGGGANALQRNAVARDSVVFEDIYASHFINYQPQPRFAPLDETGNMLIICYDAWLPNIQPLVTHKNSIGIPTTAVGVSTIGNNVTAIKAYIQSVYNQGNLAFVLLVGDAAQIATPSSAGGAADPTYSKLAGSDNYPDIFVGRFSAETAAHVDTQVLRTIEYENMPATQQTWFKKGTGIASAQGAGQGDEGQADYVHMDEIRGWLLGHLYTTVDQIYDTNGGTAAMVTTALNAGRGIINYCGHGSMTSWGSTGFSNSNVTALTNDNKLPFIISVACVNGQFDAGTCFAEAWLRATHNGEPTGAVATYMSSINQDWAPPMEAQDEFNILFTSAPEPYHSYGALCYAGSCSMMDAYGSTTGSSGVNMFDTWHIFGDPSLRIVGVVTLPHGIEVTPDVNFFSQGPVGGPFAPASLAYTIKNLGTTPLNYEVTKSQSWLNVTNATGTLPGHGTVVVTLSISAAAESMGTGLFNDTVYFTNTTDHDGDVTQPAALKIGVPTMQYSWNLDTNPGWATTGQWAFGPPAGAGGLQHGYPDPAGGMTGTNVYGVNLAGDYLTTAGGPYYLTLGPVNLQATSDVTLKFQRWLNSDYQPYVYATLEASNNGTTWTQIWSNGATVLTQNAWALQTHNISAVATDQPAVYLRWGYKVAASGAYAYSGWNIDDIQIWGLKASGAQHPVGDLNCDGNINFLDINPFVLSLTNPAGYAAAFPDCDINLADINADGSVNFGDINPFVSLFVDP
jgi:hypothetical protein